MQLLRSSRFHFISVIFLRRYFFHIFNLIHLHISILKRYTIGIHMTDFLKMDVFFAVTTSVVVLGGVFMLVALFYVIRILRSADYVVRNIRDESDDIRGDMQILRKKVRDEGVKIKHFMDFFGNIHARNASPRKKKKSEAREHN